MRGGVVALDEGVGGPQLLEVGPVEVRREELEVLLSAGCRGMMSTTMWMITLERRQTWSHSLIGIEREGGGYRMAYETESALCLPIDVGWTNCGICGSSKDKDTSTVQREVLRVRVHPEAHRNLQKNLRGQNRSCARMGTC